MWATRSPTPTVVPPRRRAHRRRHSLPLTRNRSTTWIRTQLLALTELAAPASGAAGARRIAAHVRHRQLHAPQQTGRQTVRSAPRGRHHRHCTRWSAPRTLFIASSAAGPRRDRAERRWHTADAQHMAHLLRLALSSSGGVWSTTPWTPMDAPAACGATARCQHAAGQASRVAVALLGGRARPTAWGGPGGGRTWRSDLSAACHARPWPKGIGVGGCWRCLAGARRALSQRPAAGGRPRSQRARTRGQRRSASRPSLLAPPGSRTLPCTGHLGALGRGALRAMCGHAAATRACLTGLRRRASTRRRLACRSY